MLIKYFNNKCLTKKTEIYLKKSEIHIWIIQWNVLTSWALSQWKVLSKEEIEYILKFRNYSDRMRSFVGKLVSKILLSRYLGVLEQEIKIKNSSFGKPYLCLENNGEDIQYNISHSGEFVLLAFTMYKSIGVDVEMIKKIHGYQAMAQNFYTKEECFHIKKSKSNKKFFKYWTAKEAYVKALGVGLNKDLKSFTIHENGIIEKGQILSTWKIIEIYVDNQYSAHIAVKI